MKEKLTVSVVVIFFFKTQLQSDIYEAPFQGDTHTWRSDSNHPTLSKALSIRTKTATSGNKMAALQSR